MACSGVWPLPISPLLRKPPPLSRFLTTSNCKVESCGWSIRRCSLSRSANASSERSANVAVSWRNSTGPWLPRSFKLRVPCRLSRPTSLQRLLLPFRSVAKSWVSRSEPIHTPKTVLNSSDAFLRCNCANFTSIAEVDLNDSTTLSYYSQLLLFKEDPSRDSVLFPPTLTPIQRRTVHTLAHNMGLGHASRGTGEQRQVQVFKVAPGTNVSPPLTSIPTAVQPADTARRGLNRAATIDFSEARNEGGPGPFSNLRGQTSGFLGVLDSPGNYGSTQNLRAAKSFADLRSYTPSPVPSSASFPAALQSNGTRLQHYEAVTSGASNTPTLTSAPSGSSLGVQRDDNLLVNSLSSLSLGTGIGGPNSSPRRLRGMFSWDQPENQPSSAGPIGSNRSIGLGFDGQSQERMPIRQPRGPVPEKGSGFRRSNGHQSRGSDELRTNSGVEIIVE